MFSKFSHLVYDYCWTNFLNFSSQYNGYKKFKNVAGLANFINNETNMVNVLNVAEKNDAAKSIANIMSNGSAQRREGISKFNKIYQFKYKLNNQNVNMVMTSVSGHLLQYEFVGSYRKWNGCKPETLFDAPMIKECPEAYLPIKKTLEREVCNAQHLIIWTDGDREGENIGFEIINVCKHVNPNIKVSRAKFSEITQKSITRTCQSLCSPDSNTSIAVDIRQELDLRIGAAFTRFQTLRLKKVFPNHLAERLISYGSCQFPTLGFVVERYKQVQSFVPEPFWKIKVTHQQEDSTIEFNWKRVRLFSQPACFVIFEKCLQNPAAKVINIQSKSKSKWRPLPLDTVELEKLSSRKLKLGAKETMQIAEKLYTSGYISYPRTETNMFPKDFNLVNLVEMQSQSEEWGDFAKKVLIHGPNPRQGKKTDNAHPPIHPIKYTNNLSGKEKKVYEFIVRHFLASVSKDALGHETTVEIEISEEQFSANGLMIIERNYLDVYPYEKWNAKVIPVYAMAQVFSPSSIEMPESETSPPLLLTEADLIALMEKHGIGTDATHADHIETIKSRMYVGVNANERFVPGELGMGLVEGYDQMGFEMSKPYLRAELEADLQRICEGVKDPKEVLSRQIENYRRVFKQSIEQVLYFICQWSSFDQNLIEILCHAGFDEMQMQVLFISQKLCQLCPDALRELQQFVVENIIQNMLGKFVEGSGLGEIVFQSGVAQTGTIRGILSGKHYNRAWSTHEAFAEAIDRFFMTTYMSPEIREITEFISRLPDQRDIRHALLQSRLLDEVHKKYLSLKTECLSGVMGLDVKILDDVRGYD
ncbi:DNA topoisomerase 3-alpha [Nymphon striatum]|nr:DNA topoisomerase 3-alpha [Nymphon striatum]